MAIKQLLQQLADALAHYTAEELIRSFDLQMLELTAFDDIIITIYYNDKLFLFAAISPDNTISVECDSFTSVCTAEKNSDYNIHAELFKTIKAHYCIY